MNSENGSRWGSKFISLLLALLIWFQFSGRISEDERIDEVTFSQVVLQPQNTPASIKSESENSWVAVTIVGKDQELDQLNSSDVSVFLDLQGLQPGNYNLPLTAENVSLPSELTSLSVQRIIPSNVRVSLVHMTTKQLELIVYTTGQPEANFELKELQLTPKFVEVEGPTSVVSDMEYLFGIDVDINGRSRTLTGKVAFDAEQLPRDAIIPDLTNVTYRAVIEEIQSTLEPDIDYPVTVATTGYELLGENNTARVSIRGPITVVEWINPQWLVPELMVVEPEPLPGEDPDTITPPAPFPVTLTSRWQVPDEIRFQDPEWLAKVSRLTLTWTPTQFEVQRIQIEPEEGEQP